VTFRQKAGWLLASAAATRDRAAARTHHGAP